MERLAFNLSFEYVKILFVGKASSLESKKTVCEKKLFGGIRFLLKVYEGNEGCSPNCTRNCNT